MKTDGKHGGKHHAPSPMKHEDEPARAHHLWSKLVATFFCIGLLKPGPEPGHPRRRLRSGSG